MTENVWFFISRQKYFNSHPHEEDDGYLKEFRIQQCISTHILTKRMTWPSLSTRSTYQYFNSHPHEEDDLAGNGGIHNELYFNSHPHEEDDRASGNDLCTAKAYFNSHPHEEDDSVKDVETVNQLIFQLTSSRRGWRCSSGSCVRCIKISTHILTKRMTARLMLLTSWKIFQLTSSRRGWQQF